MSKEIMWELFIRVIMIVISKGIEMKSPGFRIFEILCTVSQAECAESKREDKMCPITTQVGFN